MIHAIAHSLKTAASNNPMRRALGRAGLAGRIAYGSRALLEEPMPYALLDVREVHPRVTNTSGVALVTYEASVIVYVYQRLEVAGKIIAAFHTYWDRLAELPALDNGDRLVDIHPGSDSEAGEIEQEDLGQDIIAASTTWTILVSEHQTAIVGEE